MNLHQLPLIAIAVFILVDDAAADQVGIDAFERSAIVEGFENVVLGPNVGLYSEQFDFLVPGVKTSFTFSSGIMLTDPIPNPIPPAGEDEIGTATVIPNSRFLNVPEGFAYMAFDGDSDEGQIKFTLPVDAIRVGAFVAVADTESSIRIRVFDGLDRELEKIVVPGSSLSAWSTSFLGIQNSGGIRSVEFEGDFLRLDALQFVAVPEPKDIQLLFGLLFGLGLASRCRRQFHFQV